MEAATNLFWRSCPVLVRRGERGEERCVDLTVRLIAAGGKHPGQRVLRLYLSDEADPFALHVLEVGEEEYAALRAEQGIRVDFANFPGKLIGLLEQCIACREEDLPRFQAVLQTPGSGSSSSSTHPPAPAGGQATLRVVENNDFKQLPHLALAVRPGSDAAVKQFLAFRLGELRGDCTELSSELERTQSERNSLQDSLSEVRRALAAARQEHERHLLEHDAELKAAAAAAAEAKAAELAEVREAAARERATLEARLREQLGSATTRAGEAESDARALREQKYGLDARVSELSHKLGAAEGSNRALTEEVERLRAATTALGREKAERDVELGEALTRVAALEDKVAGQQGLAAEQAQRMRDMEASLRQVEARAEELKAAAQGHEGRAAEATAELAKANAALEKLAADLQLQKEKVRRKAAIVARQEEELGARDRAVDEAEQRARGLQRDLERATQDAEAAGREASELRGRLEDARAQVTSNEQMIRWLNNQITETQVHYSAGNAGLLASRYSYRPGAPAPPAGSGSSATTGPGGALGGASTAGGLAGHAGAAAAGTRPVVSTYRTPGVVPSTAGNSGATSGPAPHSAASSVALQGSSSLAARGGGFRSSFYATHFGGGAGGSGAAGGSLAASGAPAAAARSLNLGGMAGAGSSAGAAPAAGTAGSAETPAAPPSSASAAKHLISRFEAPTFRMADTMAGRVAVPVTSGS